MDIQNMVNIFKAKLMWETKPFYMILILSTVLKITIMKTRVQAYLPIAWRTRPWVPVYGPPGPGPHYNRFRWKPREDGRVHRQPAAMVSLQIIRLRVHHHAGWNSSILSIMSFSIFVYSILLLISKSFDGGGGSRTSLISILKRLILLRKENCTCI